MSDFDEIVINDEEFQVKHLHRDNCPICRAGSIGMKHTRDFHTRPEMHARDLGVLYGMTDSEVMDHINCHELVVDVQQIDGEMKKRVSSPDFYLDELATLYMAMRDCFNWVNNNRGEDGSYDSVMIDQITKLNDSVLKTITKMAELQGRLKGPGDAQTKILQVEGNLNMLITDVLAGGILCPRCEEEVNNKLKKMKLL